jgi:hypothetical protein
MFHRPGNRTLLPKSALARLPLGIVAIVLAASPAFSQADDAKQILKSMSDYLASQQNLTSDFDVGLGVMTTEGQKIEFTASGTTSLARPNKLLAMRRGGYSDVEVVFDGQQVTVADRFHKDYTQIKATGTVDQLLDQIRTKYGVELPGADLLMSNSYNELMTDVVEARHVGEGVVGGRDCEHLAFRNQDTDWQIWIRKGDQPLPCKLVITSKQEKGMPEYSVTFRDWKMGAANESTFTFTPPSGFKSVSLQELRGVSDLPAQAALKKGGSQ